MAYYSTKGIAKLFKYIYKAVLCLNLQIIWEGNGFTQVFAEILNPLDIRPILNLSSISNKVGFQSWGLFNNSCFPFNRNDKLLLKPSIG